MNAINWFEIPAADFTRAKRFYEQIFAMPLHQDKTFPDINMALFPYEMGKGVGGAIVEMEPAKPNADGVRIYLNGGDDLGRILDRVPGAGGKVVMPKTLLNEDIGHIGLFADTEGNVVGLHSQG